MADDAAPALAAERSASAGSDAAARAARAELLQLEVRRRQRDDARA